MFSRLFCKPKQNRLLKDWLFHARLRCVTSKRLQRRLIDVWNVFQRTNYDRQIVCYLLNVFSGNNLDDFSQLINF